MSVVRFSSHFEKSAGSADFMKAQVGRGELKVDNCKSQALGVQYRIAEKAIVDSVNNSIKHGHI